MGTCVSTCNPCSTPSTAGAGDDSSCGSPAAVHRPFHDTTKPPRDARAVHPLPPNASPTPAASTSTSLLSVSSMASCTSATISSASSSATCSSSSFSSRPPRPFSAEFLKVRTCRDMEVSDVVVVLDPNKHKRPASVAPRPRGQAVPRTPSVRTPLSVARSPRKAGGGGRRIPMAPTTTSKRARTLSRAAPAGPGGSASRKRPSCHSVAPAPRKIARATASGVDGEMEDDLNNPLISMDCFIFL